jgi:hypothetical protein
MKKPFGIAAKLLLLAVSPYLSDDFETGTYLSIIHEGKKKNISL